MDCLLVMARPPTNRPIPMSSGTTRQMLGGGGVTLRATPSGEIRTRRSDSSAAMADTTGTPTSMPM